MMPENIFENRADKCGQELPESCVQDRMHPVSSPNEPLETPAIVTSVQVMFFDTDCAAVVHNIAYLRFIETARTLLAGQMGMSLRSMADSGEFPVVVRTEIDYRFPAGLGDHLEVRGRLEKLERSRFWVAFEVVRVPDEKLIVTCRQLLALIKIPGGKILRLPADWAQRFGSKA